MKKLSKTSVRVISGWYIGILSLAVLLGGVSLTSYGQHLRRKLVQAVQAVQQQFPNPPRRPSASPTPAPQDPAERLNSKSSGPPSVTELLTAAQANGTVRIIVGLRAEFRPEGLFTNSVAVQTQRLAIAQMQDSLLSRMTAFNVTGIKQFRTIPFLALEVDAAGLQYLQTAPEVASIQEDVLHPPLLAESVPLIGAPAAWAAGFTGAGQTIAILDTGVDKTHPLLTGKVVSEACYSTTGTGVTSTCPGGVSQSTEVGSGVNCEAPGCEHGTHVAGIAAGKGASFSGVAREANLIAIKVATRRNGCTSGSCVGLSDSDILRGLERVYELRGSYSIAAVNMSLGGGRFTANCDTSQAAYKTAIDNLRSVGIATIVATGNEGYTGSLASPACISSAISVGSTGDGSTANGTTGTLNAVSSFSNSASFLHLLAPGEWINSSVPGGGFANYRGTSMAAPHVAGAWAVLRSKSPNASVSQILMALKDTGLPITDARNNFIKPRIRVDAAANALATTACNYTITPTTQSFPVNGGTGTVNVTTGAGCAWTASSNVAWLAIASGSSGSGNGTVNYSVAANTGFERTGTLFVAGQNYVVTQSGIASLAVDDGTFETFSGIGIGGSSYRVNRLTPASYPATINAVAIFLPSGAGLSVGSSLTILAGAHPSGSATIDGLPFSTTSAPIQALDQFNIFPVPGITINSGDFVVGMQISHPAGAFPFAIDTTMPKQRSYRSLDGTTYALIENVGTPGNYGIRALPTSTLSCPTVTSISPSSGIATSTVTITGTGFTGVTAVRFANNLSAQFTVNSDTSITATVPLTAVTGRITLTKANSNCADVPTNVFTVIPCIALTPTSQSFPAAGGTGTVTLTAVSAQCPWTATSNASWLTITSGSSGTGSGAVNFSVAANTGAVTRTGTLTIAGQTFTVTQTSDCHSVTSLAPTSGQAGATVTITGVNLTNVSAVRFSNNVAATFTVVSPTQLTTTVPAGAVSGPVTLSKPGCPDVPTSSFTVIAPNLAAAETTLTAESCTPANTAIDPGEAVTVNLALRNTGNGNTSNLVATLQATGGVTAPGGPQTYGVLTAGGATVARPFTFTATGSCGNRLTATLSLQDGAVNRGTVTFSFVLGVPKVSLTENFDSVTAPALPTGWTTTVATGTAPPWVTSTTSSDTAPNNIFATGPSTVNDIRLDSPSLAIASNTAQLSFRNNYNLEAGSSLGFDGGVLEIAIGSGAFSDILTAGGSFMTGGYNRTISTVGSSPIAGRQAWSANSGGYLTSVVNLPIAAAGQTIKLRWRMVSDASASSTGWRIDTIRLTDGATCADCTPCPTITLAPASLPNGAVNTSYNQTISAAPAGSYTFAVTAGALPAGLLLNANTGVLTGTPTTPGTATFTLTATGAGNCTGSQAYSLTISGPPPANTIAGTVNFAITPKPVSGVLLTATGAATASVTTSSNGAYSLANLSAGTYTVTPTKTGDGNGISSQDASLVAQYAANLITLSSAQQLAADASGDGTVSSFDASLIAQTVVGLPNPGLAGTWKFVPGNRTYSPLSSSLTNQNFDAVLVGDVSGNWAATSTPLLNPWLAPRAAKSLFAPLAARVAVALAPTQTGAAGSSLVVPIQVGDLTGKGLVAYDLVVTFDPTVVQWEAVEVAATLSRGFSITTNTNTPGRLVIAAFGTEALAGAGTLLKLKGRVIGAAGTATPLVWQACQFNEGGTAVTTTDSHFIVAPASRRRLSERRR